MRKEERANAVTQMYALSQTFGSFYWFIVFIEPGCIQQICTQNLRPKSFYFAKKRRFVYFCQKTWH